MLKKYSILSFTYILHSVLDLYPSFLTCCILLYFMFKVLLQFLVSPYSFPSRITHPPWDHFASKQVSPTVNESLSD